jgi:hypothetical protein
MVGGMGGKSLEAPDRRPLRREIFISPKWKEKGRRDGPMRARLRLAITMVHPEPPRRLGTQICIATFAKGVKSASTEDGSTRWSQRLIQALREIFVGLHNVLSTRAGRGTGIWVCIMTRVAAGCFAAATSRQPGIEWRKNHVRKAWCDLRARVGATKSSQSQTHRDRTLGTFLLPQN